MLRVDLRDFSAGPIETVAKVPATDPALAGLDLRFEGPITVAGRLMESGPAGYFWDGRVGARVTMACRRCLTPVTVAVDQRVQALFTEDEAADDPAAYVIPRRAVELDLGATIRDELILAAPGFVVCRDECRGLCARCGEDLNLGPCECRPEPDPRWAALKVLDTGAGDDTR
ncbi:MAG TPA: DUF177 domain-containing protein [Gemmatimonadales bacterium]